MRGQEWDVSGSSPWVARETASPWRRAWKFKLPIPCPQGAPSLMEETQILFHGHPQPYSRGADLSSSSSLAEGSKLPAPNKP